MTDEELEDSEHEEIKADALVLDEVLQHLKDSNIGDIQILVSKHFKDSDRTYFTVRGFGNWHARMGMCQRFIEIESLD